MLEPVHCVVGGRPVDIASDWFASSRANGGYDAFSATVSERIARKYSAVSQQAPVELWTARGKMVWAGELVEDPTYENGRASLVAQGYKYLLEEAQGRLCYQTADMGVWSAQADAPTSGSPTGFSVQINPGGITFTCPAGVNASNAVIANLSGATIEEVNLNVLTTGTVGTLQLDGVGVSNGAKTYTPGAETFTLTLAGTPTTDVTVNLRDIRINDLTLTDSFTASHVALDVGRRAGLDVTGLSTGGGLSLSPARMALALVPVAPGTPVLAKYLLPSGIAWAWKPILIPETGVSTSALNILPLDWTGSWFDLLAFCAQVHDWRFLVLGDVTGNGPLLDFGPWSPEWRFYVSKNASPKLKIAKRYGRVVVKYRDQAGAYSEYVKTIDDTIRADYPIELGDRQRDELLVTQIAEAAATQLEAFKWSGSIDIYGGGPLPGLDAPRELCAGAIARLEDKELRVTQVEQRQDSVSIGVGGTVNVAGQLALSEAAQNRRAFGVL